jgi:hypothetical protein
MTGPGGSGGVPRRSPLIGRSDELSSVLRFCAADAGGSILISGDAGIGKSRLLDEIAERRAAAHVTVLRGHAVRGGGPFRPLVEALVRVAPRSLAVDDRLRPYSAVLGRLLPGWPVVDGPAGGSLVDPVVESGEAVLELLQVIAGEGRLLVLLDDLQWADRDTSWVQWRPVVSEGTKRRVRESCRVVRGRQHEDLDVFGGFGAGEQRQPVQHAGEHQGRRVGRPQLAIMQA